MQNKVIIPLFLVLISMTVGLKMNAQEINTDSIEIAFKLDKIDDITRLDNNYAPFVHNLYALTLANNSTVIYNADTKLMWDESFTDFSLGNGVFVAKYNENWEVFQCNLETDIDSYKWNVIPVNADVERVQLVSYDAVLIYTKNEVSLVEISNSAILKEVKLDGFSDVIMDSNLVYTAPLVYNDDLFIRFTEGTQITFENETFKAGKGYYQVNSVSGKLSSSFSIATLQVYPSPFVDYGIILKDGKSMVYNFAKKEVVETDFINYYISGCEYLLVVKKDNISFCTSDNSWMTFESAPVKEVTMGHCEFEPTIIEYTDGKKVEVDFWNGTVTEI